jgi:murein DD-endopeptidase MepM/ murein hydrolase activator NlpD
MANEFYTLIVVPHAKARFRKFQVSVRLTKWVLGATVGFTVILAGILSHYTWITVEVAELRRLRGENTALRAENETYKKKAGNLEATVLMLQSTSAKLGVMMGLEKSLPEPQVAGVGGLSSRETTAPSLDAEHSMQSMEKTVHELTTKFSRLESHLQDQRLLLASTPSIWPVRGYLSGGFGNRTDPFTGLRDFHPGLDISTPVGTKVIAPADGVVIFCGVKGGYGNAMVVDHGYGVVTRYAHLASFGVRPGQRVRRGDVIAYVGNTGRSTAPHLHYEVWVNDTSQNPIHYILDEYRSFG